jgi:hypothetical protein
MSKAKNLGSCRLCKKEGRLCYSHVFPEFFYEPTYDDSHRFISISGHPLHNTKHLQKGFREYLLCRDCETKFSVYEGYASKAIKKINDISIQGKRYIEIDLDYKLFKLFGLSLIWRCHISSNNMFTQVDLGKHAENIRKMLINENPGHPNKYCILLIKVTEDMLQRTIVSPVRTRFLNHNAYTLLALGIRWILTISSGSNNVPRDDRFLGMLPALRIPVMSGNLEQLINRIHKIEESKTREA